jgi:DNA repair protein RadC
MGRRYTIKQLPPELRPRERLLAEGPEALSSAELLGILFGTGSPEKTAVELASEVISENGDFFGLYNVSVQLPKHKTVGAALSRPTEQGRRPADRAYESIGNGTEPCFRCWSGSLVMSRSAVRVRSSAL